MCIPETAPLKCSRACRPELQIEGEIVNRVEHGREDFSGDGQMTQIGAAEARGKRDSRSVNRWVRGRVRNGRCGCSIGRST